MAYCPKCGAKLPENAQFCGNCGSLLSQKTPHEKQNSKLIEWYKNNIFTYKGRLNRLRYLKYVFLNLVTLIVLSIIITIFVRVFKINEDVQILLSILIDIPFYIATILLAIRRAHDINLTGWSIAVQYIIPTPIYLGIALNSERLLLLGGFLSIFSLIFGLILLFYPGTKGVNKYGEDPLAKNRKN